MRSYTRYYLYFMVCRSCAHNATVPYPDGISDTLAFLAIVRSSSRSMTQISSLVRTIVGDATIYFIVIFTSHIIVTFFVIFARVSINFCMSRISVALTTMWEAG